MTDEVSEQCGATLAYSDMLTSASYTCVLPRGHKDAHQARFSRMTWTATDAAVSSGRDTTGTTA